MRPGWRAVRAVPLSACVLHSNVCAHINDLSQNQNQNQNELYCRVYDYTYQELVFVTEASTVQQNDSDRTKNTDNEK